VQATFSSRVRYIVNVIKPTTCISTSQLTPFILLTVSAPPDVRYRALIPLALDGSDLEADTWEKLMTSSKVATAATLEVVDQVFSRSKSTCDI
jgi:hypothetical protein